MKVCVGVGVKVRVGVGVGVGVKVGVAVGVVVMVGVALAVGVNVGVSVAVGRGVFVRVGIAVAVGVDVGAGAKKKNPPRIAKVRTPSAAPVMKNPLKRLPQSGRSESEGGPEGGAGGSTAKPSVSKNRLPASVI